MNRFSQEHLSNELLRREIQKDETREGEVTAFRLARIAEYDARRLYLEDAFPSMHAWCMGELRLSIEEAKKRIRVARVGHRRVYLVCADELARVVGINRDGRLGEVSGLRRELDDSGARRCGEVGRGWSDLRQRRHCQ